MKVAIVGGGSSAHVLAVLLAGRGHEVCILTSRPQLWNGRLELNTREGSLYGQIKCASDDPAKTVGVSQISILCMPVHQYPIALKRIMPYVAQNKEHIVGTVYGQAGFDKMVSAAAQECGCEVPLHFAIGLLPWIARTIDYGQCAISYGPKLRNGIATSSQMVFDYLQHEILDDFSWNYWQMGRFERVPNFLTLTLTVDNQIIHPSRCFALAQGRACWETVEDIPYFYRDWDDFSAEVLQGVDADYSSVRAAIFRKHPELDNAYNLDYLSLEHWSYGSHNPDIKASFVNSQTLREIKPPTVRGNDGLWRIDVNHRFFKDDFDFGLAIAKKYAKEYGCEVKFVDKLLAWYNNDIKQAI